MQIARYRCETVSVEHAQCTLVRPQCTLIVSATSRKRYKTIALELKVLSEIVPSSLPSSQNAEIYAETYLLVLGSFWDR